MSTSGSRTGSGFSPEPIPIGETVAPPFARLPEPEALFAARAARFRALAPGHGIEPYLTFLGALASIQASIQEDLPISEWPTAETIERALDFGMPPLNRADFVPDRAFTEILDRLLTAAGEVSMPDQARKALARVAAMDGEARAALARNLLADSVPAEQFAEHGFVAAALQVHFARLAAALDAGELQPVGDGACPACGSPPVSSLVVGWEGAHGTRFCACGLCGTLWNHVRVKCTLCGSTEGIAYHAIENHPTTVKAETCDSCRCYLKILLQHIDPELDPVADDIATLALDLLVREAGWRRGAVNPFLLGY